MLYFQINFQWNSRKKSPEVNLENFQKNYLWISQMHWRRDFRKNSKEVPKRIFRGDTEEIKEKKLPMKLIWNFKWN